MSTSKVKRFAMLRRVNANENLSHKAWTAAHAIAPWLDDGKWRGVSMERLARTAKVSRWTIADGLDELVKAGEIMKRYVPGRHNTNVYQVSADPVALLAARDRARRSRLRVVNGPEEPAETIPTKQADTAAEETMANQDGESCPVTGNSNTRDEAAQIYRGLEHEDRDKVNDELRRLDGQGDPMDRLVTALEAVGLMEDGARSGGAA